MRLNAPKTMTLLISVILIALGLIGQLVSDIPFVTQYNFWFAFAGGALLSLACLLKGL